ncbi:hypothetical protein A33Q_2525 [Indibacter alkaliphilus LW1]|uniref:Uncharacterized protein n=1 Tax=Indibacter alkaliphilus (strain CCUG 57479 / KCTC 22604 / LW1) TaxID=1189612 RepID=S2D9K2_INDAL|nr:hypothetical protein A33Q_2525 [Indibacter alkaliphilus LW1]
MFWQEKSKLNPKNNASEFIFIMDLFAVLINKDRFLLIKIIKSGA